MDTFLGAGGALLIKPVRGFVSPHWTGWPLPPCRWARGPGPAEETPTRGQLQGGGAKLRQTAEWRPTTPLVGFLVFGRFGVDSKNGPVRRFWTKKIAKGTKNGTVVYSAPGDSTVLPVFMWGPMPLTTVVHISRKKTQIMAM